MWLQLPTIPTRGGAAWSLENVISIRRYYAQCDNTSLLGIGSGKRSGDVVLLQIPKKGCIDFLVVLDLELKEVHTQDQGFSLLDIDLLSRLQNIMYFLS